MGNTNPKSQLYSELSRIAKALSSPGRLELIELLAQGERTVEALAHGSGLSAANASHHLQVLREARLVEGRKEGLYVHYRLAGPDVFALSRTLRDVGERRLAEVGRILETYFRARDKLEPVGRRELLRRAEEGTAIVLDVRPPEEYRAGHIPGAISVPVERLGARLAGLPRGTEIVAYCRGPYCVMAFDAVRLLRARGRKARRLEDGFPEWRAAGLPVATGADPGGDSPRRTSGRKGAR